MWTRFKNSFKKPESQRRSQRDLDRLFMRSDHVLDEAGLKRVDIFRTKGAMK